MLRKYGRFVDGCRKREADKSLPFLLERQDYACVDSALVHTVTVCCIITSYFAIKQSVVICPYITDQLASDSVITNMTNSGIKGEMFIKQVIHAQSV